MHFGDLWLVSSMLEILFSTNYGLQLRQVRFKELRRFNDASNSSESSFFLAISSKTAIFLWLRIECISLLLLCFCLVFLLLLHPINLGFLGSVLHLRKSFSRS
jgi:hypothetical protein